MRFFTTVKSVAALNRWVGMTAAWLILLGVLACEHQPGAVTHDTPQGYFILNRDLRKSRPKPARR